MPITADAMADMVTATLQKQPVGFNQIAQRWQEYHMLPRILKKDKVVFGSGRGLQKILLTNTGDSFQKIGLFTRETVDVPDVLNTISVPWVHAAASWAVDVKEDMMNSGPEELVDLALARRTASLINLADGLEIAGFGKPTSSADTLTAFGLTYWLVKNATTGFTGADPAGFPAGAGGIAIADVPQWANYAGTYDAISKAAGGVVLWMRDASYYTHWLSPVGDDKSDRLISDNYMILTNRAGQSGFELLAEAQNENLGPDLYWSNGKVTFRRNPMIAVPYLDDDTTNPFYMVNMKTWYPIILKRNYLRQEGPRMVDEYPDVRYWRTSISYNFFCEDRRRNAVAYYAA